MRTEAFQRKKVEDLAEYITVGFVGSMSSLFVKEGVPLLRGQNVLPYSLDLTNLKYVSQDTHKKWKKSALNPGDVVIVRVGYPGTASVVPVGLGDLNAASLVIVRPNPSLLDSNFLAYVINSPWGKAQVAGRLVGAAQQVFNTKTAAELEIPAPPLPIQRRIAGILSAYDELIENSQRRIRILESMARTFYREWFVHFRFPGHEHHPRIASPLGEIPQGWEVKSLGDVCTRITDGSHSSPKSVTEGYPMASVKDMHDWGINFESCRKIASSDFENLVRNDCKPKKNDILIAKDGSYLKHTFVVAEEQEVVILSSIAMLRPSDAIFPNYLCAFLRDPVTKSRMKGIVSGVAIPRIVLKDFRKFQVLVPPNGLQADWAKIVDPLVEMCRELVAQTENLRRTRDLLLPRLLSGQIDVETSL